MVSARERWILIPRAAQRPAAEAGRWDVLNLPTDSPAVLWELSTSITELGLQIQGCKIESEAGAGQPGGRTRVYVAPSRRRGLRARLLERARAALARRRELDAETGLEEGAALRECLSCSICLGSMRRPVGVVPCAHAFDEACIVSWTRARAARGPAPESDVHNKCPVCRGPIRGLVPNRVLGALAERCAPAFGDEPSARGGAGAGAGASGAAGAAGAGAAAGDAVSIGPPGPAGPAGSEEDVEHVSVLIRSGAVPADFWDPVRPGPGSDPGSPARPAAPAAPTSAPVVGIPVVAFPAFPPRPPPRPPARPKTWLEARAPRRVSTLLTVSQEARDAVSRFLSSAAAALRTGVDESDRERHAAAAHAHAAAAHAHAAGYYRNAPFSAHHIAVLPYPGAQDDGGDPARAARAAPARAAGAGFAAALAALIASAVLASTGGAELRAVAAALGIFGGILVLTSTGRCVTRLHLARRPRYLKARVASSLLSAAFLAAGGFLLSDTSRELWRGFGVLLVAYGSSLLDATFFWLPPRVARTGLRRSNEHIGFLFCLVNLVPLGGVLCAAGAAAAAAAASDGERPILAAGLIAPGAVLICAVALALVLWGVALFLKCWPGS
eukprot:tig00021517_g21999.t1